MSKDNGIIELNLDENADSKEVNNFKIETVKAEFPKYPVEDILKASKEIDIDKIAEEILVWLDYNLENYIDNSVKMFKIPIDDLDVEARESNEVPAQLNRAELPTMDETKRLQSLYRGIPDDEGGNVDFLDECQKCRTELNKITESVCEITHSKKDLLDKLYKRMTYYYEFRGFDKNGVEIVQDLQGFVSILKFEYEAFSVGVRIREGVSSDSEPNSEQAIAREYVIPEGFVVWIELAAKSKERPQGIF